MVMPLLKLAVGVCLVMSIMQNKETQINTYTPPPKHIKMLPRKREREIENGIPVNGRHSGSDEASYKSGLSSCVFPFHHCLLILPFGLSWANDVSEKYILYFYYLLNKAKSKTVQFYLVYYAKLYRFA
jgi:hypothetical protein